MKKSKAELMESLAALVRRKYESAKDKRGGVFSTLQECVSMIRGDSIVSLDESIEFDIQGNIVAPIARGIIGMLRDIYGQNGESPFVLEPTPIVELPPAVEQELKQKFAELAPQLLQDFGMDTSQYNKEYDKLEQSVRQEERRRATQAAESLSIITQDKLTEGGWRTAFEHEALQHFVMFPTVIVKCPVYKPMKVKVWNGSSYDVKWKTMLTVETVSPFNFYPSPDATDAQTAEYVIERRTLTSIEMLSLSAREGYDVDGLDTVLEAYPDGYTEMYENGAERGADLNTTASTLDTESRATNMYDTLGYFGRISGKVLTEYGIQNLDPKMLYEAEVWIVGKYVIKAVLNPDKLGRRPFYSASFEPIPNAFWGECPVTRIRDHQRACTSALAHLFRNLSFASGPIIEREINRLDNDQETSEFAPYEIIDVKNSQAGNTRNVHTAIHTPSQATEFIAVFDKFKQEAYDAIGIPKALFGGTEGMGTIGRTSGGIATVYAQAGKALKYAMRLLEERIIEPVIQRVVDEILVTELDPSIKGDVRVRARGVSGIVEKDNHREQLNWAMQNLIPLMQLKDENGKSLIPAEAPIRLLYEQFKALGIDTRGIFSKDYELQDALQQDIGTPPDIVAQPNLDGRSQDAVNAINAMGGAGFAPSNVTPDRQQ